MIKTKNQIILIQNVQIEDSPEESEHESEHSCHEPSYMMSKLSPQISGDLSAPEVESLNNIFCQNQLFILNETVITQAEVAGVYNKKIFINNSFCFSGPETWS